MSEADQSQDVLTILKDLDKSVRHRVDLVTMGILVRLLTWNHELMIQLFL